MQIAIATPVASVKSTGNRGTAEQWAKFLTELGHRVEVGGPEIAFENTDVLFALHGRKTRSAIDRFSVRNQGNLVVALTGTDIYPQPDEATLRSIAEADRLVVYQQKAIDQVPSKYRGKIHVIPQSAKPTAISQPPENEYFDICVVGHLRDVKDPMRAAEASRLLPETSRIRILHAGGILDQKYEDRIEREKAENPRYHYLGEIDSVSVGALVARSQAMVISSFSEGGARVAGEAFVNQTPLISSKIDGVIGHTGIEAYPGFFPAGDTQALANLLRKFEADRNFYDELKSWAEKLAPKFHPDRERQLLQELIEDLMS